MIGFRANNRLHVIGAFCNFHVNSKQRETNEVRVKAAASGEDRCMMTLITAVKETIGQLTHISNGTRPHVDAQERKFWGFVSQPLALYA